MMSIASTPDATTVDAADVTTYFEKLKSQHLDTQIRGVSGTCRFDIQSTGSWLLVVTDGHLDVRQTAEPADSEVHCTARDLLDILRGIQSPFTAALQGRVRITGNLALVVLLRRAALQAAL